MPNAKPERSLDDFRVRAAHAGLKLTDEDIALLHQIVENGLKEYDRGF